MTYLAAEARLLVSVHVLVEVGLVEEPLVAVGAGQELQRVVLPKGLMELRAEV